jgi:hypothetical protein
MRDIEDLDRTPVEREGGQRTPERRQEPPRITDPRPELSREPRTITGRTYAYCLSSAGLETMRGTVAIDDLARIRYQGNVGQMRQDLPTLADQGLIRCRTAWTRANREKLAVVVLTQRGKEVLERHFSKGTSQQLYAGFVKPAEVAHDAAIYRMYQAEAGRIVAGGGHIRRVVLDYELKQKVYSPLAKARVLGAPEYARRQAEVASQNGLIVINGKIPLPDLRIEYETSEASSRAWIWNLRPITITARTCRPKPTRDSKCTRRRTRSAA